MSLNHLIDPADPYTIDDLVNLSVGNVRCDRLICDDIDNNSQDKGKVAAGSTIEFADPTSMSGALNYFIYEKGYGYNNKYIFNIRFDLNTALTTTPFFFIDITDTFITYEGTFDNIVYGNLGDITTIHNPALIPFKVTNEGNNKVRIRFQTADGSSLPIGTWEGSVVINI